MILPAQISTEKIKKIICVWAIWRQEFPLETSNKANWLPVYKCWFGLHSMHLCYLLRLLIEFEELKPLTQENQFEIEIQLWKQCYHCQTFVRWKCLFDWFDTVDHWFWSAEVLVQLIQQWLQKTPDRFDSNKCSKEYDTDYLLFIYFISNFNVQFLPTHFQSELHDW